MLTFLMQIILSYTGVVPPAENNNNNNALAAQEQVVMQSLPVSGFGSGSTGLPEQVEVLEFTLPVAGIKSQTISLGPRKVDPLNLGVDITAQRAVLYDFETLKPLYSKNTDVQVPIASITKLMTAMVFLDQEKDLNESVLFAEQDSILVGYRYIFKGEKITYSDLLHAALIGSDNTALNLMVESLNISKQDFIKQMNVKAEQMGLLKTSFEGVTGLNEKNVSSANDIAKMLKYAYENYDLEEILSLPSYDFKPVNRTKYRRIYSTNDLLISMLNQSPYNIEMGKTGYIDEAGYCLGLVVYNQETDSKVIAVVLGSETSDDRFQDMKSLVVWGFNNYKW